MRKNLNRQIFMLVAAAAVLAAGILLPMTQNAGSPSQELPTIAYFLEDLIEGS